MNAFKTCQCCKAEYTEAGFMALPMLAKCPSGTKVFEDEGMLVTEYWRNCYCGSTLLVMNEETA